MIRVSFAMALALLLAAPCTPAHAGDEDAAKARGYFEKGMGHFQLEEYDAAIEMWEEGFRLKPVPEFLYNIAQAFRLSKRPEKALQFYRKYLRLAPEAPNRAEVERQITTLNLLVEQQQNAATAPPQEVVTPGAATVTPAAPMPALDLTASPPRREKPLTKRPWFWGVVGGGGAVVVAAVVVGVVLGTRGDSFKALPALRF